MLFQHLAADAIHVIASFIESSDFLRLWMCGQPALSTKLVGVRELRFELPNGTLELPSSLLKHTNHLQSLRVALEEDVLHCMVKGLKLIESFSSLTKLELHVPFSLPLSRPIERTFPRIESLEFTIEHEYDIMRLFPMPDTLKVLRIMCYKLPPNPTSFDSLQAKDLVPELPKGLETFAYRSRFAIDDSQLTWPAGLTDLDLVVVALGDEPLNNLPALQRLRLLLCAPSRWDPPNLSSHVWSSIPRTVRHLRIETNDNTVALHLSPKALRGLDLIDFFCHIHSSRGLAQQLDTHAELYKQMPNLQQLDLFLGTPVSPYFTQRFFDDLPSNIQVASIDTGLTGVASISRLPPTVLRLSLRSNALPLQKDLFKLPPRLVSLNIFASSPVECDFPPSLTELFIKHCSLSEGVKQLPHGLKKLELGAYTVSMEMGFAILPPCLESLTVCLQSTDLGLESFSASFLPKTLTSLDVELLTPLGEPTEQGVYGQRWWSSLSPDLPLRFMSLKSYEYTAQHGDMLIPRLPRTLRSLTLHLRSTSIKWAHTLFQMIPSRLSSLEVVAGRTWLESEPFLALLPKHLHTLHLPYWKHSELTKMVERAHIFNCSVRDSATAS